MSQIFTEFFIKENINLFSQDQIHSLPTPLLWLAASADRRVSIWSADWSKDFCELVDWLTFPAPPIGPDGKAIRRGDLVREYIVIETAHMSKNAGN